MFNEIAAAVDSANTSAHEPDWFKAGLTMLLTLSFAGMTPKDTRLGKLAAAAMVLSGGCYAAGYAGVGPLVNSLQ